MLKNFNGSGLATIALVTLCATACAADSIDNYALPAKIAFPAAMPRYATRGSTSMPRSPLRSSGGDSGYRRLKAGHASAGVLSSVR